MLHVSIRRRIAVTTIAVVLTALAVATAVIARNYAPRSLRKRAETALRDATRTSVTVGRPTVSVDGSVTFSNAAVSSEGGVFLRCGPVRVSGLPDIGGQWRPREIHVTQVVIIADFSSPDGWRRPVAALCALLDKASGLRISAPPDVLVDAVYEGIEPAKFSAACAQFIEKRTLELAPRMRNAAGDSAFTIETDHASFAAPLDNPEDVFAQAIAVKAGRALLSDAANRNEGRLTALWSGDGEKVTFSNPKGWILGPSVVSRLASRIGNATLEVAVTSFTSLNGVISDVAGAVFCSVETVESKTLSEWLAAAGIQALSGTGIPAQFENVRIAADFSARGGTLAVRPAAGKPAFIWCEVGAQAIPLFSGEGSAPVADFLAKMGLTSPVK